MAHEHGDVSAFTVGGTSLLCTARDATLDIDFNLVDGSCLTVEGETPQETKREATLQFSTVATISSQVRVSHLDLSAFTLASINGLAQIRSIDFGGSFTMANLAGAGASWKLRQNHKKKYEISLELDVTDDGLAQTMAVAAASATYADRSVTLSFTLNAITYTLPCRIKKVSHGLSGTDLQKFTISLEGSAPDSGAYPTAPTTSTTILDKALNAWKTAVAVVFTPKSADSVTIGGNFIFQSFNFRIEDEALVTASYTLASTGAVTVAAN